MNAQTFLDNLGHIANAPEGVQRLREMIYNLAITGDLNQQKSEDGDGKSLLEKITETRRQLIESKSFKRSPKLENLRDTFATELPDIPGSWVWTRLVDIGEINPKNQAEDDIIASFASMSAISEKYSEEMTPDDKPWSVIKKGFTHFADGDVVLAKITPCFENGKSAVVQQLSNGIGAGTTELHVIRPITPFVDPRFIYIFLRSPYFKIAGETHMTGTAGQKRLPTEYFATRPFPLPPIEEQKCIVVKVDELMALCDKLEALQQKRKKLCELTCVAALDALSNAQRPIEIQESWSRLRMNFASLISTPESAGAIRQTILQLAAYGKFQTRDPNATPADTLVESISKASDIQSHSFPPHWVSTNLGSLGEWRGGGTPSKSRPDFWDGQIPWVSPKDMKALVIKDSRDHVSEAGVANSPAKLIPEGSLLMVVRGMILAKAFPVALNEVDVTINQDMKALIPKIGDMREFILLALRAFEPLIMDAVQRSSHGTCKLSTDFLNDFVIGVPPIEEQKRILEKANNLIELVNYLESNLQRSQTLSQELAVASVVKITGTQFKEQEKMKAPKMALVSALKVGASPKPKDQAPLTSLLTKNEGELSAKTLWSHSGLKIEEFYQQLKTEMANGWIIEPEKAVMREVTAN